MLPGDRLDAVNLEWIPEGVGEHDCPRPRPDGSLDGIRIGVVGRHHRVDEHRHEAVLDDGVNRRREPSRSRDHLITRPKGTLAELGGGQGRNCEEVRARSTIDEHRVASSDPPGELPFELRGKPTRREPEVEGRIDEVLQLVCVKHLAGHWHRRLPGLELEFRKRLGVILGDQLHDPGAELLSRRAHGWDPCGAHPSARRYHSTVRLRPSERLKAGAQPRRVRALVESSHWAGISFGASD